MSVLKIFNAEARRQRELDQKLLLKLGDKRGSFSTRDIASVGELLMWGANPNARDRLGNTALMKAVQIEKWDAVLQLLLNGAKPEYKNIFGTSANSVALRKIDIRMRETFDELVRRVKIIQEQETAAKGALFAAPSSAAQPEEFSASLRHDLPVKGMLLVKKRLWF